jgi:hypothetical protein
MQTLARKIEGKRPLGKFGRRWENNIEIDIKEIGQNSGKLILLSGYNPAMAFCKHGNELSDSIKGRGSLY